jgi:hypothetical protein
MAQITQTDYAPHKKNPKISPKTFIETYQPSVAQQPENNYPNTHRPLFTANQIAPAHPCMYTKKQKNTYIPSLLPDSRLKILFG